MPEDTTDELRDKVNILFVNPPAMDMCDNLTIEGGSFGVIETGHLISCLRQRTKPRQFLAGMN